MLLRLLSPVLFFVCSCLSSNAWAQYSACCVEFSFKVQGTLEKDTVAEDFLEHANFEIDISNCSHVPLLLDTAIGIYREDIGYFVMNIRDENEYPICIPPNDISRQYFTNDKKADTDILGYNERTVLTNVAFKDKVKRLAAGKYILNVRYIKKLPDGRGYYEKVSSNSFVFWVRK